MNAFRVCLRNRLKCCQPVSKPLENGVQASQLSEPGEDMVPEFVAYKQASVVGKPPDRALDFVAPSEASQLASVLQRIALAVSAVRTDEVDPSGLQTTAQRVAVGGFVVEQALGGLMTDPVVSISFSIRFTSAAEALAMSTPIGVPWPSTRIMSFVPLPRWVGPMSAPLFSPAKTCRRRSSPPS